MATDGRPGEFRISEEVPVSKTEAMELGSVKAVRGMTKGMVPDGLVLVVSVGGLPGIVGAFEQIVTRKLDAMIKSGDGGSGKYDILEMAFPEMGREIISCNVPVRSFWSTESGILVWKECLAKLLSVVAFGIDCFSKTIYRARRGKYAILWFLFSPRTRVSIQPH